MPAVHPLTGLRVLELGSGTALPYLAKLLVDAGAEVVKVESPMGDRYRRSTSSGHQVPAGEDGAWFRFLNAGKSSMVLDLEQPADHDRLVGLVADAHLVLDDHRPVDAHRLNIAPGDLRAMNAGAVVATLTPFGADGPWADRPATDFTLQALTGSTDARGTPGEEPYAVGGELGAFVAASMAAPTVVVMALAARATGVGAVLDISQFEAMMHGFQVYRRTYDEFAPEYRPGRQIEIPSVEPALDGQAGFTAVTGQQWSDFCAMVGAPELAEDEGLVSFDGRMARRDEVWAKIRSFTRTKTVDELVELATAFRIPTGPVGTGDKIADFDHFVERGVYVESAHGFRQPRPAYQFGESTLAPFRPAPALGSGDGFEASGFDAAPSLAGADPAVGPLAGVKILDLSAFLAGPVCTNHLRVLGAEVIKVESHIRLDGMRWASGLSGPDISPRLWEWSPAYHGANAGKSVINLDLGTERGRTIVEQLMGWADVVVENFSPRVFENWGFGWEHLQALNPNAILVRMPAYGTTGPWRDRVGFAMTMEQVSGLANRTGHPDHDPLLPKGAVDFISGSHAAFAIGLALAERERTGRAQLVEVPLIEGALQASAEQAIEWSAYGTVVSRIGNRSTTGYQSCVPAAGDDEWLAISVETDRQWQALAALVGADTGLDWAGIDWAGGGDAVWRVIDAVVTTWSSNLPARQGAAVLTKLGVPAAACLHYNDSGYASQLEWREFYEWHEHPITGWTPYQRMPVWVDGAHRPLGGRAPTLGEHTDEILRDVVGLSGAAIEQLWADGVTGDWPAGFPKPGATEENS
ncbi:MAG: CoA transferase [Acidimicrobiales bacterium]|nr:CoA transferase [Acidimicrobiales bacterium]